MIFPNGYSKIKTSLTKLAQVPREIGEILKNFEAEYSQNKEGAVENLTLWLIKHNPMFRLFVDSGLCRNRKEIEYQALQIMLATSMHYKIGQDEILKKAISDWSSNEELGSNSQEMQANEPEKSMSVDVEKPMSSKQRDEIVGKALDDYNNHKISLEQMKNLLRELSASFKYNFGKFGSSILGSLGLVAAGDNLIRIADSTIPGESPIGKELSQILTDMLNKIPFSSSYVKQNFQRACSNVISQADVDSKTMGKNKGMNGEQWRQYSNQPLSAPSNQLQMVANSKISKEATVSIIGKSQFGIELAGKLNNIANKISATNKEWFSQLCMVLVQMVDKDSTQSKVKEKL